MKKLTIIAVIAIVMMAGCTFLTSKNELLTKESWYLKDKKVDSLPAESKSIRYKDPNEGMVFTFDKSGSLFIEEDFGNKIGTLQWKFRENNKELIVSHNGNEQSWHIISLDKSRLAIHISNTNLGIYETLQFRHLNNFK